MKRRILVTGSSGFIGRNLINALRKENCTVIEFNSTVGDISSFDLNYIKADHVFHLAAATFVPESWKDPYHFYNVNVMGTENVLEFCRNNKCSLTFLSTYTYGQPKYLPIDEKHPLSPNTPYNHSKVLAENMCEFYANNFNIPITILRPFNVYGPYQKATFLIPSIISQAMDIKRDRIEVMDLRPKRDYIYIADLVEAMLMTVCQSNYSVYNVGSGKSDSVEEVIKAITYVLNVDKKYYSLGSERKNEVFDTVADISKIQKELGWNPRYSIIGGISDMLKYRNYLEGIQSEKS